MEILREFMRELKNPWLAFSVAMMAALIVLMFLMPIGKLSARDLGQWPDNEVSQWYRGLMQPDVPTLSCCGEADAYFCDDYYARDGKAYCKITDERDDAPLKRRHIDIGTEIEIPPNKLKFDRGNPVGHAIVFLSNANYVWCFVQAGGV